MVRTVIALVNIICTCLVFKVIAQIPGPDKLATRCEVCKILAIELKSRLEESGKSKEVLRLGQGIDEQKKKKVNYHTSELRLIEAVHEPHVCGEVKKYHIHKERWGSNRFAKGKSETMSTLQGLVNKGVKVTMDIPYELWNETSAEVADLERKCYSIVSDYEEYIEEWYYEHQNQDLADYLCRKHVLKNDDPECLTEEWDGVTVHDKEKAEKGANKKEKKSKNSGNKGTKPSKGKKLKGKKKGDSGPVPASKTEL